MKLKIILENILISMVTVILVCSEPFANTTTPGTTCFVVGGSTSPYAAEFGFVSDAFPVRRSLSAYGQTTYKFQ